MANESDKTEAQDGQRLAPAAWLDALRVHVANMKVRESDQRELSEEHRIKAEVIMRERMELEKSIYETEKRNRASR